MAKTFYIVNKFLADICFKSFRQFIHGASKHKILPYRQSQFITDVIKPVIRIKATSPYTYHIEICPLAVQKKLSSLFFTSSPQKMFFRNVISSHGKKSNTIYLMCKAFSPLIFFSSYCHGTQTNSPFPGINSFFFQHKHGFYLIKRLFSQTINPPEQRMINDNPSISVCVQLCFHNLSAR